MFPINMAAEPRMDVSACIVPSCLLAEPAAEKDMVEAGKVEMAPATPAKAPQLDRPSPNPAEASITDDILTLEVIGSLEIGKPVPANSSWGELGAQVPGPCRIVRSPTFPGIVAIVEEGEVRRISLSRTSDLKLVEGIGAGATEATVRAAFPGFREEPHKHLEKPAKYLTARNATEGVSALRFEIAQDGKVSFVHVGTMPALGYVEGCA